MSLSGTVNLINSEAFTVAVHEISLRRRVENRTRLVTVGDSNRNASLQGTRPCQLSDIFLRSLSSIPLTDLEHAYKGSLQDLLRGFATVHQEWANPFDAPSITGKTGDFGAMNQLIHTMVHLDGSASSVQEEAPRKRLCANCA